MSDFTPEIKKAVDKHLKKMNEELAKAITDATTGANKSAIDEVQKAIAEKQKVIGALPGVIDADGIAIPFAVIYDVFSEFDDLASVVGAYIGATHATPPIKREKIEELVERIKQAIERMRHKLIGRYTLPTGVEELLKGMIEELEKLMQLLKDAEDGKPITNEELERAQGLIRASKKIFFEQFKSGIPLWDVYDILYHIDDELAGAIEGLARSYPPDSRPGQLVRARIEAAKAMKEKLERLVLNAEYPPGGEDLPPFPPPNWALVAAKNLIAHSTRGAGKRSKG